MDRIFRQQFSLSPASADNVGATDRAPDHFGAEESLDIEHVIYGYFYSKEGSVYAALPLVTIPSYNSAAMQNPWVDDGEARRGRLTTSFAERISPISPAFPDDIFA